MNNPLAIEGKTILITGAASGIGSQCALDFANAGANLVLLDLNSEALEVINKKCEDFGVSVFSKAVDLTDEVATAEVVEEAVASVGKIHGMLHAAGIEKTLPFNKLTTEDYERIYRINVIGGLNLVGLLSKKKYRGDNAKYVMIASITALVGRPGVAAYAASKGALVSAVKTLALELAPKGATINCISPGTIMTPLMCAMMESLSEEQQEERKAGFPLGLGQPSDIANTAMFLLSDGARWITGQNIVVDGGYTVR